MNLIGLMLVRNEDWILGLSARAALDWCDGLVIFDHASTDRTPDIIYELMQQNPGRIYAIGSNDASKWNEMEHRQATLEVGRRAGGDHFAIIDADEVLTHNLQKVVRSTISGLGPAKILDMPMLACWKSLDHYRNDSSVWSRSIVSLGFKDAPGIHWKAEDDGYQHHSRVPRGQKWSRHTPYRTLSHGGVMHLQFSNWRRCRAKQYWYRMVEAVRWPGRESSKEINDRYNMALDESGIKLVPCRKEWWDGYIDYVGHVDMDSEPWHEKEIIRLWKENDMSLFDGIEIPGEVIDPKERPLAGVLDAAPQFWICEECKVVGALRYRKMESQTGVQTRLRAQHERSSNGCSGKAIKVILPEEITKDQILARLA